MIDGPSVSGSALQWNCIAGVRGARLDTQSNGEWFVLHVSRSRAHDECQWFLFRQRAGSCCCACGFGGGIGDAVRVAEALVERWQRAHC